MKHNIPLYKPCLGKLEREYLLDAFDSGWISSKGRYVGLFEEKFANMVGRKYALSVCNGTCALHLALEALQLKKGSVVLCPSLTYVASANAIRFAGLMPLFVDCDENGLSNTSHFQIGLDWSKANGHEVSAIMPVHLYGNMSDVNKFATFKHEYKVVEDAAESFGSTLMGKPCGSYDTEFSCFSFFGNKTITTGEGGMVVCDDSELYQRARLLRGVGQDPTATQRYNHLVVGYNYRMTNLEAAIGLAQLFNSADILSKKKEIASRYREKLDGRVHFLSGVECLRGNNWLVTIGVPNNNMREGLMLFLSANGIETRPAFLPMHTMVSLGGLRVDDLSNSEKIGSNYLNLPSFPELTLPEVDFICEKVLTFVNQFKRI